MEFEATDIAKGEDLPSTRDPAGLRVEVKRAPCAQKRGEPAPEKEMRGLHAASIASGAGDSRNFAPLYPPRCRGATIILRSLAYGLASPGPRHYCRRYGRSVEGSMFSKLIFILILAAALWALDR